MNQHRWTTWDEFKQRLRNSRNFLKFAWLVLWWDSRVFAAVFYNTCREEGEDIIAEIKLNNGKVYKIEDLPCNQMHKEAK